MGTRKINGLPVVDATKSVFLKVNAKDVLQAKKKGPEKCAAALACKRQLKATEVRVHLGRTYVRYNGNWERYVTSSALRDEIVAFDRGGQFMPGEYLLMKMQPSRAYDKKFRGKHKKRKYTKHSPVRHMVANVRPVGIYA